MSPVHNETMMMQLGTDQASFWVAVEPMRRQIPGLYISGHRNMIVAESFLRSLSNQHLWNAYCVCMWRWSMVSGVM